MAFRSCCSSNERYKMNDEQVQKLWQECLSVEDKIDDAKHVLKANKPSSVKIWKQFHEMYGGKTKQELEQIWKINFNEATKAHYQDTSIPGHEDAFIKAEGRSACPWSYRLANRKWSFISRIMKKPRVHYRRETKISDQKPRELLNKAQLVMNELFSRGDDLSTAEYHRGIEIAKTFHRNMTKGLERKRKKGILRTKEDWDAAAA